MNQIVYEYNNNLYLNITNKCPNMCIFCIKTKWNMNFYSYNLKLEKEPKSDEVLNLIRESFSKKYYNEIVFCGYGEPTMRWNVAKEISANIKNDKAFKNVKIRINTNGMGNIINRYDITKEMKDIIDAVYISLNTANKEEWYRIMKPHDEYKENAFESVLDFIRSVKKYVREVVITAVELKDVDIDSARRFAEKQGLDFRLRPYL